MKVRGKMATNCSDELQSTPHKDTKNSSWKLLEKTCISTATRKFGVDRKRIHEWIKQKYSTQKKIQTKTAGHKMKRLDGGGRKVNDDELEHHVLGWIHNLSVEKTYYEKSQTFLQ